MLQAIATLIFLAIALVASGIIAAMVVREWAQIRRALGLGTAVVPQPVPPCYRAVPSSRTARMTIREATELRVAA